MLTDNAVVCHVIAHRIFHHSTGKKVDLQTLTWDRYRVNPIIIKTSCVYNHQAYYCIT